MQASIPITRTYRMRRAPNVRLRVVQLFSVVGVMYAA